jgi:hypothetical protein
MKFIDEYRDAKAAEQFAHAIARMSPNEQKITFGRSAISMPLSISSTGVTHTGQPAP